MITYNGADFTDVAPVKIDDIRVSPIGLNPVARQRATMWGQDFVRINGASRTVTITFALLEMDREARYKCISDITEWAKVGEKGQIYLPVMPDCHLDVSCTGLPEPSMRMWWENKLRITFQTFENPYWTSNNETTAGCNQDFTVGGNAPPLMRIERTLSTASANQSYSSGEASMNFSQIPAGSLVIDLNNQISTVSGTNIDHLLTPTSTYIKPQAGTQRIKGVGTVVYNERWI